MKGYKVVLEDVEKKLYHVVAVIADDVQEAIDLARLELKDTDNKLVLYDMELVTKGAILTDVYYE